MSRHDKAFSTRPRRLALLIVMRELLFQPWEHLFDLHVLRLRGPWAHFVGYSLVMADVGIAVVVSGLVGHWIAWVTTDARWAALRPTFRGMLRVSRWLAAVHWWASALQTLVGIVGAPRGEGYPMPTGVWGWFGAVGRGTWTLLTVGFWTLGLLPRLLLPVTRTRVLVWAAVIAALHPGLVNAPATGVAYVERHPQVLEPASAVLVLFLVVLGLGAGFRLRARAAHEVERERDCLSALEAMVDNALSATAEMSRVGGQAEHAFRARLSRLVLATSNGQCTLTADRRIAIQPGTSSGPWIPRSVGQGPDWPTLEGVKGYAAAVAEARQPVVGGEMRVRLGKLVGRSGRMQLVVFENPGWWEGVARTLVGDQADDLFRREYGLVWLAEEFERVGRASDHVRLRRLEDLRAALEQDIRRIERGYRQCLADLAMQIAEIERTSIQLRGKVELGRYQRLLFLIVGSRP